MADCTCDQINKIDVDGDGTIGALHTGGLTSSTSLTTGGLRLRGVPANDVHADEDSKLGGRNNGRHATNV